MIESLNENENKNAKKIQQIIVQTRKPQTSISMSVMSAISSEDAGSINRETSPEPSPSDFYSERPAILYSAQIRDLDIKTRFACRETSEQVAFLFLLLLF